MFWLNVCSFLSKACLGIIKKHPRKVLSWKDCLELLEFFLLAVGCLWLFFPMGHLITNIVHIRSILLRTNISPSKGTFEHVSSPEGKSL